MISTGVALPGCSALSRASYNGDYQKVKILIANDKNRVDRYDRWGWNPLLWAVYYNQYVIVKYLLEKGADPNLTTRRSYRDVEAGWTPMLIASYYGYSGSVKLLLKHGAKTEVENKNGNKAITFAEQGGHKSIVRLLEAAGSSL